MIHKDCVNKKFFYLFSSVGSPSIVLVMHFSITLHMQNLWVFLDVDGLEQKELCFLLPLLYLFFVWTF